MPAKRDSSGYFGGDIDLAAGSANRVTHQLLAVPIAVGERGIDQIDRRRAEAGPARFPLLHTFTA